MAQQSIWFGLVIFTQQTIQNLSLPLIVGGTLPNAQVYARRIMTDRDTLLPAIIVAPWESEQEGNGDFEDLEVSYPVVASFITASNQDYSLVDANGNPTAQNSDLLWRQLIMDNRADFAVDSGAEPPFTNVTIDETLIEPFDVSDYDLWRERNLTCGAMKFTYRTTRQRLNR